MVGPMRGGVRAGFVGLSLVAGCGLSLSIEPLPDPSTDGGTAADTTAPPRDVAPPPPPADVEVPDTTPPPPPALSFDLKADAPIAVSAGAIAEGPAAELLALAYVTPSAALYDLAGSANYYTFPAASAPTSFAALTTASAGQQALFTVAAPGLAIVSDGTVRPLANRADVSRVFGRGGHVYVASRLTTTVPGGTKVMACKPGFPATESDCDVPMLAYDADALAGFAVSPDDLLLAGITGTGASARVVLFSRPTTSDLFTTAITATFPADGTTDAIAIVGLANGASEVRVHLPCSASTNGCVRTFAKKP